MTSAPLARASLLFVLPALAGCLVGPGVDQEPASAALDPAGHEGWVRVTACAGWALCLPSLVAAQDGTEPDAAPIYPLRVDMGVVSDVANLEVSASCDGHITVTETEIRCAPNGDASAGFAFGSVRSRETTEDGYRTTTFTYDETRVALWRDPSSTGAGRHYLEITAPGSAPDPTPAPAPDATVWEEVVACSGWDLCLPSLVAVADPYEPEAGAHFPMRFDIGVVSAVNDLEVTESCRGRFALDASGNLACAPDGDATRAFVVGTPDRTATSDDGETVQFFRFDPTRIRLLRDPAASGAGRYRLEILPPSAE